MGKAVVKVKVEPISKMKKPKTAADILIILDRSGSMEPVRDATIEGVNSFVREQAKLPGARISLIQFDTDGHPPIEMVRRNVPAEQFVPLNRDTYRPSGGTPLYDACGKGITDLAATHPSGKVIVAIVTDGEENSSHKWAQKQVFDLINEKRTQGWEFVFLGAGVDAYKVGTSIGVAASGTYGYANTRVGTQTAYAAFSGSTSSLRSGMTHTMDMTQAIGNNVVQPDQTPQLTPGMAAGANNTPVSKPGKAPKSTTSSSDPNWLTSKR